MTDIANCLPQEVWVNTFQRIYYKRDLCQCRLVCQAWNQPAKRALFSSNINLDSDKSAIKLHQLLMEKPQLARLIKEISLDYICRMSSPDTIRLNLLKASFTSNMEKVSINSFRANTTFFATLIDAAESSSDKNFRLKKLPSPADDRIEDKCYIKAVYIFRESLEMLRIPLNCKEMDTLLKRLAYFKNLKTLELDMSPFESVQKLEAVLKNCNRLDDLELFSRATEDEEDDDGYVAQDKGSVLAWAVQNVKQVKTVKKVNISKPYLDLVYYMIYKYPNMEFLICHGMGFYDENHSLGLLDAAKGLPRFCTHFFYHGHQDLQSSISSICALDNMPHRISVSFEFNMKAGINEDYGASMGVQTTRGKEAETLELYISLDRELSTTVPVNILERLQTATAIDSRYSIYDVSVDAVQYRPFDILENDEVQPFYQIINQFPNLKRLNLAIQRLQYEKSMVPNDQLETLKIGFAEIDAEVLPQISQHLPRLHLLDIHNCSILNEEQQRQGNMHINVPHSSLALLNVQVQKELFVALDHYDDMVKKWRTCPTCYLDLTILDVSMALYCRVDKYLSIVQLSCEQFETRPDKEETVTITVTCKSIGCIHLELGRMRLQINVEEFVLRKLQSQINALRAKALNSSSLAEDEANAAVAKELEDKEQMYNNYLDNSKFFNEKLDNLSWTYFIHKNNALSIIKDVVPTDDNQ